MFLKKIHLEKFKVLENISINFEERQDHNVFPIIGVNGGGKSTLLQFIFTFLNCAFIENRQKYLKSLLEYYNESKEKNRLNKIAYFEIENEKQIVNLEFYRCKSDYKNFNSIITLKELIEKKNFIKNSVSDIELLNRLENDLSKSNISPSLAWRELRKFADNQLNIHSNSYRGQSTSDIISFISVTRREIENSLISDDELSSLIIKAEAEKNKLVDELEKDNLSYVFHFNENSDVLLFKSNTNKEILIDISNRIYLATPNTQLLHFLEREQLDSIFRKDLSIYSTYESYIRKCQEDVQGLFTYEFSAINLIIDALAKAKDDDFKKLVETGSYGNKVNETLKEFSGLLFGKSITIDNDLKGVTFRTSKITLSPKDLSHGELKKLSIYIWLKAKTHTNSVILMDEVDMGLHPTWQYELYNDLQKWSTGNQFILATHSPQIISKAYYKNLVVIKQIESGATSEQFTEAPLESDLNTIVKTIMGGDYIPRELAELRKKYRTLFENNKLETEEAKEIKKQMLTYESENSSFFQDIKFQMELR